VHICELLSVVSSCSTYHVTVSSSSSSSAEHVGLPDGEKKFENMFTRSTEYTNVTDSQTDGHRTTAYASRSLQSLGLVSVAFARTQHAHARHLARSPQCTDLGHVTALCFVVLKGVVVDESLG